MPTEFQRELAEGVRQTNRTEKARPMKRAMHRVQPQNTLHDLSPHVRELFSDPAAVLAPVRVGPADAPNSPRHPSSARTV